MKTGFGLVSKVRIRPATTYLVHMLSQFYPNQLFLRLDIARLQNQLLPQDGVGLSRSHTVLISVFSVSGKISEPSGLGRSPLSGITPITW